MNGLLSPNSKPSKHKVGDTIQTSEGKGQIIHVAFDRIYRNEWTYDIYLHNPTNGRTYYKWFWESELE